jgi:hypothetical protein
MLSSRDVLEVLDQLRKGLTGLNGAATLVRDPSVQKAIDAIQNQLSGVISTVEDAARRSGVVPKETILPRPHLGTGTMGKTSS